MAVEGAAAFKYSSGPVVTHDLQQPLRDIEPVRRQARWEASSLDFTASEVVTVGSGVHEIVAVLRYESDEPGLLDALEYGANGGQLDYYPDTVGSPGTFYPSKLVEPSGNEIRLLRDRDLGPIGEHEVTIRLRREDGGTYDALL